MNKLKKALLINDLSLIGKSSLTCMMPIISSYKIETIPLPTLLLSNHTGYKEYITQDIDITSFTNVWKKQDISFDLIYTGFFKDANQIKETIDIIDSFKSNLLVVDPVLGDDGERYSCFNDEYTNELIKLVSKANIITPNITEARLITNCDSSPIEVINKLNNKYVVITGIKKDNQIGYLVKDNNNIFEYYLPYIECEGKFHGTGDVFASSLIGNMLNTNNFKDSFYKAANFTNDCILATVKYLPEHWYGLAFEEILSKIHK